VRTEGLRRGVRLGHAGLVGPEEQAVHVGQLHHVVVCVRREAATWVPSQMCSTRQSSRWCLEGAHAYVTDTEGRSSSGFVKLCCKAAHRT